ncbi:MAG: family 43 glycosylhydrolase [Bacteroidaceae bacterium]|nr:family 43 glycosylhydrolase [Bacteroidaceae bacterium]
MKKRQSLCAIALLSLLMAALHSTSAIAQGARGWTTFVNGTLWQTAAGDTVQAHAPGFLYERGRWWMVGEDRANGGKPDVNLYSSRDLQHWRFERKIIANGITSPLLGRERMIERAKLLKSPVTGRYVVWCHWEASNYGASESACFSCATIDGDYVQEWAGRPCGIKARDCNVFVDEDGTAYFIATTNENQDLGLFRLSTDYTRVVAHTPLLQGLRREAPAVVKIGDTYYMLSSACTGWAPNQCKLSYSKSLTEGWSPLEDVGDATCYRTQAAAILTIKGTKQTTYLYVGDRWKDPTLAESKTIVFPVTFQDHHCQIFPLERFQLNLHTGVWRNVE